MYKYIESVFSILIEMLQNKENRAAYKIRSIRGGGRTVANLSRGDSVSLMVKVTFKQKIEGGEGFNPTDTCVKCSRQRVYQCKAVKAGTSLGCLRSSRVSSVAGAV